MVQCLNIVAAGVALCPDISNNRFRCDVAGINHTAQIQTIDGFLESNPVNLCDNLGIGYCTGMESQQNIFFINTGEGNKRFRIGKSLFPEQLFIGAVTVDNHCLGEQHIQFLTASPVVFDNFDINATA